MADRAVLALVAAVLWTKATRPSSSGRLRGTGAVVVVVAALVAAALGLTVMTRGLGFGWAAPGIPVVTRTAVAVLPRVAVGAWGLALLLMGIVLLRRRGGVDEAPDGSTDG